MREDLRRLAVIGSGVAELTKNRAEQMVKELVERSKENRKELVRVVRGEIENQISALGLATKKDLERLDKLERRIARLEAAAKDAKKAGAPKKKTTAKKTTAKPSTSGG